MTKVLKLKLAKFSGLVIPLKDVTGATAWGPYTAHSEWD